MSMDNGVQEYVDVSTIGLAFDGPDYQGTMAADELGQVLIAFSEYAQAVADTVDFGNPIEIRVSAFKGGSFDTILEFVRSTALAGVSATFVFKVFKFYWQNIRNVAKDFEHIPDRGIVKVTFNSGEVMEMTEDEWRLFNNGRVRKALGKIIRPLRSGATSLVLTSGADRLEILATDVDALKSLTAPQPTTTLREVWAQPDTVRFDPTKRWRLNAVGLGPSSFVAGFEDESFKSDLATGRVTVGKNDQFKLRVRVETEETEDGPHESYFIEKVLEHTPGATQFALPSAVED